MAGSMNPVNWFEIPVTDMQRAKAFYEACFRVELSSNDDGPVKMAWFPAAQGGDGATGSLVQAEGYTPSTNGTVVYFRVEDIEGALSRINDHGGKTMMPKTDIGEYGFIAHFGDCEGNRVALHSMK
jgi:predicted enzyme related to lactoylglutathione lyase